ncbi:MAG: EAL domain-containing protein, partial [Clostridia bacterium]|nr:EAL domain-containing protein [Clostridia bacterium]
VICMPKELYSEKRLAAGVQEIRALLDSPHFSLHMHIGVYEVTDLNMPVMVMIDRADIARKTLYRNSERFVAFYTEEMLTRQLREQQVIAEFEQAMTGDQFRILLQPQVNRDGIPSGAEALVRWMLPNGHLIMPGEFVEILERSDLICRMDQRVWELTVRQLAAWKGTCFEQLHLSINVSPKDFYYIDVPAILEKLCMKYEVSPEKLRVEITETVLADETCNPAVIVERLHNIGFRVEIDDFGKGYSSLSLLKDICADTLKVDMEFLRHTPNEKRSRIILRSIARMAEDLGMEVIVEGIETEEQVNWLSSNGYQNFQGFYFSRPITSDAFMQNYKSIFECTRTSPT